MDLRCPRCQRPLADAAEGVYVCCADAPLRWRCHACGKVSDGFAFPYGRCPSCGGMLALMDARPAVAGAAERAVRLAFEIEIGGRAFYQRAAAESREPVLRDLFGRFAVMEGEHMETLARRYHLDVPDPSPDFRIEVAAVFAGVEHRPRDPGNLFRVAVALERRAADFFTEQADQAAAGSAERELFRELAAEEHEHAALLEAEFARWNAGLPGSFGMPAFAGTAGVRAGAGPNAAAQLLAGHDDALAALVCDGRTLTRGELREQAARCAAVWAARGVEPGDRVAIKLPDGCDWVSAFLGTMWAGAVAVAVNPRIPAAEWQYILDEAGFAVILAPDDDAPDDTPWPWREHVVGLSAWQAAVADAAPLPARAMAPDAPAFWVHSSGTSGKPKAVVHGHRFVDRVDQVSREGLGIRAGDRIFGSSKLFFAYPQTNGLFAGLKLGATVLLDPRWPTAAGVVETVQALRPTVLLSVPSLYRNLLHDGLAARIADGGVRLCVSAGEALPDSLREAWRAQTGLGLVDGYGASEVLVLAMLDRGDGRGFQPSPGIEVRPVHEVEGGAPTRLTIHAPTVALGYYDRPQAQAETFRDGAFCPADLWARTEGGGWRFAGREDSLVKIRGRWVNLIDLAERLAGAVPGVVEGAAVCVPDADGVDAVAFFYVADDAAAAGATLAAGAEALPPYQRPRWLHPVATLPRTPTGKLLRRKLQELHRSLLD